MLRGDWTGEEQIDLLLHYSSAASSNRPQHLGWAGLGREYYFLICQQGTDLNYQLSYILPSYHCLRYCQRMS